MKYTVLLIAFSCMSCVKNSSAYKRQVFHLQDKSGEIWAEVSCSLPVEFDTLYRWHNYNPEYYCEGSIYYRAHSTGFETIQENGIWQEPRLDSGYYFTVSHLCYARCDDPKARSRDYTSLEMTLNERSERISPEFRVDTSIIINGLAYDILTYYEVIGRIPFYRVEAITDFNSRYIAFRLQNNIHSREEFFKRADRILRSLKIKSL